MSRLRKRLKQAQLRGAYILARGSCPLGFYSNDLDKFDVYIESEGVLGPRNLALTKRQASALAYRISVSAKPKISIETIDYKSLCIQQGIAVYKVADSCLSVQFRGDEQDKWFASVPEDSDLSNAIANVPLGASEDDAFYLAYKHLQLAGRPRPTSQAA